MAWGAQARAPRSPRLARWELTPALRGSLDLDSARPCAPTTCAVALQEVAGEEAASLEELCVSAAELRRGGTEPIHI